MIESEDGGFSDSQLQHRSASTVQNDERMDSILKIDAKALLRTIAELEQRLSEHQRPDKIPVWAQTIVSRLEQLEKAACSGHVSISRHVSPEKNPFSGEQENAKVTGGSSLIEDPAPANAEISAENLPLEGLSLASLAAEDRLLSHMRNEFEAKLCTMQLQMEGMVRANALELERLHKLLSIRPTTSEFQQVMLAVNQVEQRSHAQLQEMNALLVASVRDRISEEMISFLDEIKASRAHGESVSTLIGAQIRDFGSHISEMRQGAQNSIEALEKSQDTLREELKVLQHSLLDNKRDMGQALEVSDSKLRELRVDLNGIERDMVAQSKAIDAKLTQTQETLQGDLNRMAEEQSALREELSTMQSAISEQESIVAQVQFNINADLADLRGWRKSIAGDIADIGDKLTGTATKMEELVKLDLPGRMTKHDEVVAKMSFEMHEVSNSMQQLKANEIKNINTKLSMLQEQCSVALPGVLTEHSHRMDRLADGIRVAGEEHDMLKLRVVAAEETLEGLLPLRDRVTDLLESRSQHAIDLMSLKEGLNSCHEANGEFAKKLEELGEMLENIDASIDSRMNRIRDTLLETLLEKQNETKQAMRAVEQNLEVMSMAGDIPLGSISSSLATPELLPIRASDRDRDSPPPSQSVPATGPAIALKPVAAYRRPSMASSDVLQGSQPSSNTNNLPPIDGGDMSDAGSVVSSDREGTGGAGRVSLNSRGSGRSGVSGAPSSASDRERRQATGARGNSTKSSSSNNASNTNAGNNNGGVELVSTSRPRTQQTSAPSSRGEIMSAEYSSLVNTGDSGYKHSREAQFIADLCVNFEEISVKKKRVTFVPPVICQYIAKVTHDLAEFMAGRSDFEMVETALAAASGDKAAQDLQYDENFVVGARQRKIDEYLLAVLSSVSSTSSQPGVVRLDARALFLSLVKKALEMFMSKHNQILQVGNSRLGRVKIPTCIACDRPLIEKARIDSVVQAPSITTSPSRHRQLQDGSFADGVDDPVSNTFPAIYLENSQMSGVGLTGTWRAPAAIALVASENRPKTNSGNSAKKGGGGGNNRHIAASQSTSSLPQMQQR